MIIEQPKRLIYHHKQNEIFFESNARYKVIAKGRRFGLTRGFAQFVIEKMCEGVSPVLWIDTVYGNIERYVERYFAPPLNLIARGHWRYRANRNDLRIGNAVCDFRSADRPENIEGFGYALIIINEAGIVLKNRSLWNESIRPMLMDYKAQVLIGGTPKGKTVKRTGERHLFYELFERTGNDAGQKKVKSSQWQSFNYSSYDNPFLEREEIDELVNEISPALREQEVFGKFVDKESRGIINSDWWRYYEFYQLPQMRVLKFVQSWDTAFKANENNDFSVCTTWAVTGNGYFLVDMFRDRLEFPELKRKCRELYELHNVNEVLVEDKASGQSLIQELRRETRIPIKAVKPDADKIARVHSITPVLEAGKVFLPAGAEWVRVLRDECSDFPDGEFDDVVDSVSQFLNYVKGKARRVSSEPVMHFSRKDLLTKYSGYWGRGNGEWRGGKGSNN